MYYVSFCLLQEPLVECRDRDDSDVVVRIRDDGYTGEVVNPMLIIGVLVVTQVTSIVAMNLALADGDDERGEELVVRNGQGNARFHLVVGEVSLNDNVNNAVNVVEGGFAIVSLVVVVIFSVGGFCESTPTRFAGTALAFVLDVHLF